MANKLGRMSEDGLRIQFEDWHMANPVSEALENARFKLVWGEPLTSDEISAVRLAVESYVHLTNHPSPTYQLVNQLRQLRATNKRLQRKKTY